MSIPWPPGGFAEPPGGFRNLVPRHQQAEAAEPEYCNVCENFPCLGNHPVVAVHPGHVAIEIPLQPRPPGFKPCRVYWGSHGCHHPRGHDPVTQPHACDCCTCGDAHPDAGDGVLCVAQPPYYGPGTRFYGEEAETLGLPLVGSR